MDLIEDLREALGFDLLAVAGAAAHDDKAPRGHRARDYLPGAVDGRGGVDMLARLGHFLESLAGGEGSLECGRYMTACPPGAPALPHRGRAGKGV